MLFGNYVVIEIMLGPMGRVIIIIVATIQQQQQ